MFWQSCSQVSVYSQLMTASYNVERKFYKGTTMKKLLLLSAITAVSLYAGNITFENAPVNPSHKVPTSANEILSFNSTLGKILNTVVNISTKTHTANSSSAKSMGNEQLYRHFFGPGNRQQIPRDRLQRALGSGVILSSDGYIVTNNHVVAEADEITVTMDGNKKEYSAKLIGTDPGSDLAVIKIEATGLHPITLSRAKDIHLGDVVFAIGNPFGVGETVTQGIVSALNKHSMGINQYENFIQTDASINPGNSGGALVDSRGTLIGINSAIISRSGGNNGIGFTIPVDMMRDVVTKLIEDGKVDRGYMGVVISKVTEQMKILYAHKDGAVVTDVQAGSASESAGLKRGDLIYAVDGKKVDSPSSLQRLIASLKPDTKVDISIERDKKEMKVPMTLSSREGVGGVSDTSFKGMSLVPIDKNTRSRYRIPMSVDGVLVARLKAGSQAEKDGFHEGDVMIQIENHTVASLDDVAQALRENRKGPKRVYVNRNGVIMLLVAN